MTVSRTMRLKDALVALLSAYRISHDPSWTVNQLICRLNQYPKKMADCEEDVRVIRPLIEEDAWIGSVAWHAANAKDLVEKKGVSKQEALNMEAPALWAKLSAKCRLYHLCGILTPAENNVWYDMSRKRQCPPSDAVWRFAQDLIKAARSRASHE